MSLKTVLIPTKIILNFRKLKNRVAAQSSRDRKKARLDDLETEVRILKEKVGATHVACTVSYLILLSLVQRK